MQLHVNATKSNDPDLNTDEIRRDVRRHIMVLCARFGAGFVRAHTGNLFKDIHLIKMIERCFIFCHLDRLFALDDKNHNQLIIKSTEIKFNCIPRGTLI